MKRIFVLFSAFCLLLLAVLIVTVPKVTQWVLAPVHVLLGTEQLAATRYPADVPDITMRLHDDREWLLSDLRQEPLIVGFGFTHCPHQCPIMLTHFSQISAGVQTPIKLLFVTIDPKRDTVERMQSFFKHFPPTIFGARIEREQAFQQFSQSLLQYFPTADGEITLNHAGTIFMFYPGVEEVLVYRGIGAEQIVKDIELLNNNANIR